MFGLGRGGSILGLIILILDIWAIVDILKSGMDTVKKILWILVVVVFPVVGLILYVLLGRGKSAL